jgi:hypothetical protein
MSKCSYFNVACASDRQLYQLVKLAVLVGKGGIMVECTKASKTNNNTLGFEYLYIDLYYNIPAFCNNQCGCGGIF